LNILNKSTSIFLKVGELPFVQTYKTDIIKELLEGWGGAEKRNID